MDALIEAICCCFLPPTSHQSNPDKKLKKQKRLPKPSRIRTKYSKQTIHILSKQQKLQGIPVYTCPICTCYLNKILACDNCNNTVCRKCIRSYEKNYSLSSSNMRCPFCNSESSLFLDYELEPKKYFDTSSRSKKMNKENLSQVSNNQKDKLQKKNDEQSTSGIPTERNGLPLKEIHVLNARIRKTNESSQINGSSEQMSQMGMLGQRLREQNPENNDLSFIDQFQLRTVEDVSD